MKKNLRKCMALALTAALTVGVTYASPGNLIKANAEDGFTQPAVSTYATKDQLMTSFVPDSNGTLSLVGKLYFGNYNSSSKQEWYIVGKDDGVTKDGNAVENVILVAAKTYDGSKEEWYNEIFVGNGYQKPTGQTTEYDYDAEYDDYYVDPSGDIYAKVVTLSAITDPGTYSGETPEYVNCNHYGISAYRETLKNIAESDNYFSASEKSMMLPTTVSTYDTKNNCYYSTTDKLYAPSGSIESDEASSGLIKVGSSNQYTRICGEEDPLSETWLRSPNTKYIFSAQLRDEGGSSTDVYEYSFSDTSTTSAVIAGKHDDWQLINMPSDSFLILSQGYANCTDAAIRAYKIAASTVWTSGRGYISGLSTIRPVADIDLTDVTFASAAKINPSTNTVKSKVNTTDSMYLRYKPTTDTKIGTIKYYTSDSSIVVTKGEAATGKVYAVVQGSYNGKDWYYETKITVDAGGDQTIYASDIADTIRQSISLPNDVTDIDLTKCKVWLESYDSTDGRTYAVEATRLDSPTVITVSEPTADLPSGTYTTSQSITLSSGTDGAKIYYTTDGSDPSTSAIRIEYTGPISVTGTAGSSITTTIQAIAVMDGMADSPVQTFTYTVDIPAADGSGTGDKDDAGSGDSDDSGKGDKGDAGSGDSGDSGKGDKGDAGSGDSGDSGKGDKGDAGSGGTVIPDVDDDDDDDDDDDSYSTDKGGSGSENSGTGGSGTGTDGTSGQGSSGTGTGGTSGTTDGTGTGTTGGSTSPDATTDTGISGSDSTAGGTTDTGGSGGSGTGTSGQTGSGDSGKSGSASGDTSGSPSAQSSAGSSSTSKGSASHSSSSSTHRGNSGSQTNRGNVSTDTSTDTTDTATDVTTNAGMENLDNTGNAEDAGTKDSTAEIKDAASVSETVKTRLDDAFASILKKDSKVQTGPYVQSDSDDIRIEIPADLQRSGRTFYLMKAGDNGDIVILSNESTEDGIFEATGEAGTDYMMIYEDGDTPLASMIGEGGQFEQAEPCLWHIAGLIVTLLGLVVTMLMKKKEKKYFWIASAAAIALALAASLLGTCSLDWICFAGEAMLTIVVVAALVKKEKDEQKESA